MKLRAISARNAIVEVVFEPLAASQDYPRKAANGSNTAAHTFGNSQGERRSRSCHFRTANDASTNFHVCGFHLKDSRVQYAMLPRWQTVTERAPISTSQIGRLRDLMQFSQSR